MEVCKFKLCGREVSEDEMCYGHHQESLLVPNEYIRKALRDGVDCCKWAWCGGELFENKMCEGHYEESLKMITKRYYPEEVKNDR